MTMNDRDPLNIKTQYLLLFLRFIKLVAKGNALNIKT